MKIHIQQLIEQVDRLQHDTNREQIIERISNYIHTQTEHGGEANIVFVCTHNSRRSQLAQVWAVVLAHELGIENVKFYSAGTESTAFHQNAVNSLLRNGINLEMLSKDNNPAYSLSITGQNQPYKFWSKCIDDISLPKKEFAAVMVCSDADINCPMVPGAKARFSLTFVDPKESDGRNDSDKVYDLRSQEIAMDILKILLNVRDNH